MNLEELIDFGPVSHDNRVLNGPLSCSLRLFVHTAHSAHSLCSLPRGTVEIYECVHIVNAFYGNKHV